MTYRKLVSGIAGVAAAAVVSLASGEAHALTTTCTVTNVAWTPSGSGTLQFVCGGAWYYAFGSSGTCPVADIETRKQWASYAQTALLTGRQLYIDYNGTCSGGPGLTYVRLN